MHALETLFSFISLQFKIVSNTVRMYESIKAYICNKYILNTERKIFNYDLIVLCRVCITLKRNVFFSLAYAAKYKLFPSKDALKCPKMLRPCMHCTLVYRDGSEPAL